MPLLDPISSTDTFKIISRLLSFIHEDQQLVHLNIKQGTNLANLTGEINGNPCSGLIEIIYEILKSSASYHNLLGRTLAQKYLVRQWADYGVRYVVGNRFQSPIVLRDLEVALSKTYFIAGDFITLCDLIMFYGLYSHVAAMEEEEKEKYNNICHWFLFLQRDPEIIQNLKRITFPRCIHESPGESFLDKRKSFSTDVHFKSSTHNEQINK